ncbi:MAG: hypothetical protein RXP98_00675 [Thermoplasmata archaeon]
MYIIIKVDKKKSSEIDELYKDDIVSRQSIIKREGISIDLKDDSIYILVEGSDEGINRAKEIAGKFGEILPKNEMEEIYKKFKAQDESSLEGMGSIFG